MLLLQINERTRRAACRISCILAQCVQLFVICHQTNISRSNVWVGFKRTDPVCASGSVFTRLSRGSVMYSLVCIYDGALIEKCDSCSARQTLALGLDTPLVCCLRFCGAQINFVCTEAQPHNKPRTALLEPRTIDRRRFLVGGVGSC